EKSCTPGQLALAWLLAQGRDIVPIPGTKRKERLEENVNAASVRLDARDAERIAAAIPARAAAGTRHPEAQPKGLDLQARRSGAAATARLATDRRVAASRSAASARFFSVISRPMAEAPMMMPDELRSGDTVIDT